MMENVPEFTYHHVRIAPKLQAQAHSQPTWELSLVVKGSGYRIIGETREHFGEGDLVLIPPGISHCWYFDCGDIDSDGNIENITLMFDSNILKSLMLSLPSVKPMLGRLLETDSSLTFTGNVGAKLRELLTEMEGIGLPLKMARFLEILLLIADNLGSGRSVGRRSKTTVREQRLKQIETYIACNFTENITLDDIAMHVGMNKSSMCCMFKRATGQTILGYIIDKRLEQAKYLLTARDDSESIASVCYKVGFQSVSHFNHLFKEKFRCSPRQL